MNNMYRRRGASLKTSHSEDSNSVEQGYSGYSRSARQSSALLARRNKQQRQRWAHADHNTEPDADSSETVTVKRLPQTVVKQLATPLTFPGGLDAFSFRQVARRQREQHVFRPVSYTHLTLPTKA